MPDDEPKRSATSKITSGIGKFARDAAVSSVFEKGIREISKNKSLRRAGKDLIVNYARSKTADKSGGGGARRYESESEDSEEEEERRRAAKGKGKGKSREMNSMGRGREYYESDQGGRSRSVNQGYYDAPRREPPPPRSRKSSFGDSWLEKAFGSAPSWNRGSGFTTNDDPRRGGGAGLSRSMSNPGGQPQSQQQVQGYSYSHGGHGYAFRDPPSQARASIDGLPAQDQHYSPYDPNYRHHQSARREDEERDRAFRARQQELGGVAMSSTGVPLYGYRPGEEPMEEQQRPQSEHRGLPRFFSAMAHSPVTTPGGGSGGNRTPIETRVGTFNSTGSGLYSKVFSRSPPVPAGSPNAVEGSGYVGGMKELPGLPQTRHSLPPELKSKTQRYVEPVPPTSEQQYQQQMQQQQHQQMLQQQQPQQRSASHSPERTIDRRTNTPAVVQQSSTRGFPTPQITAETTIQTLSFASRCSQIVYHLSTPPSVRHYQKNYDSHLSNPSLLETHFADPNRGTKNWALLRRKVDGALIVAVRGSGRGLSRGTDYSADMSWLDDEEWLSDMMLNLKAKKWSGGTSSGGSISRRNSTGGGGNDKRKTLSLSSIRCADGSIFEAHEGFLKCAMAMYADVGRAVDKKLKMWTVLAASSGVQMGIGGKGSPAWEERLPQQQQGGGGGGEFISPPEIIFTGHSAGGAVASLLYVLFDAGNRELLDRFGKVSVITFGTAAAFPHPRSAPLTHANTHSSRRSNAGRVRDVHISIIHKDDPIPRMDVQYALSLLETALGGPRNASAALMGLQAVAGQSKNREVGELVKLVREGAERAKELRKREKEVKRMKDAAEEVVGGGVPGQVASGSGSGEMPPKTNAGMMLWPAGDLFLLAPASSPSSGGKDKKRDDGSMPKSILKSGSGSSKNKSSSIPKVQTPPTPTPTNNAVQMQLYTYTHSHLARSKPAEWSSHRIAKYFSILDEMEKRIPGLRV